MNSHSSNMRLRSGNFMKNPLQAVIGICGADGCRQVLQEGSRFIPVPRDRTGVPVISANLKVISFLNCLIMDSMHLWLGQLHEWQENRSLRTWNPWFEVSDLNLKHLNLHGSGYSELRTNWKNWFCASLIITFVKPRWDWTNQITST